MDEPSGALGSVLCSAVVPQEFWMVAVLLLLLWKMGLVGIEVLKGTEVLSLLQGQGT